MATAASVSTSSWLHLPSSGPPLQVECSRSSIRCRRSAAPSESVWKRKSAWVVSCLSEPGGLGGGGGGGRGRGMEKKAEEREREREKGEREELKHTLQLGNCGILKT